MDLAKNMDSEGNSDGPVVFVIDSVNLYCIILWLVFPLLNKLILPREEKFNPSHNLFLKF